MPLPRVKLKLTGDFRENLVEVNGHDITSAISAVQVGMIAGQPLSQVTLHLQAGAELETDIAEITVQREASTAADPVAVLRELLDQIDPAELEQQATSRMTGLDGGQVTVGQAVLAALKEWATD